MNSICVYCGSSTGTDPVFADAARGFGRFAAQRGLTVIYGGGSVGLMGVLADAALDAGGPVVGVIPRSLWEREVGHRGLTKLHIVETMHERKALMADLSDAFLALPGSIGTLDELFEAWTWGQLGMHAKPLGLLNVAGYFDGLLAFLDNVVSRGFMKPEHAAMLLVETDAPRLLERMKSYKAPQLAKWATRDTV